MKNLLIILMFVPLASFGQSEVNFVESGNKKSSLEDYYGAIADFTKAIEINPDFYQAYYERGNSKQDLEDYYGAIADYTKAIELNPDYANPYYNRGLAKHSLGDINGACSDVRKAINLGRTDSLDFIGKECN